MTIAGVVGVTKQNTEAKPESKVERVTIDYSTKLRIMDPVPEILDELVGKKIPSFRYMLYVATCETEQNWSDRGIYGGGFGFMHKSDKVYKDYAAKQSTWLQWGGAEFAKVPWKATSKEQALVWIRTYATGWVRPNGVFRAPTNVPRSNCHDDMKVGWHTYNGEEWPVPDTWKPGDPQIKPWDK
jgi:hypothetical protein